MRTGGRILVVLAALAGLVGCGARPEAPSLPEPGVARPISLSTPASGEPSCDTGLLFRSGFTDAAIGLRVMAVEVVNCGTQAVELNGYPQVELLDEHWQQLDVQILDGSGGISSVDGFDTPPQIGSHVDIAAAPGGTFQSLLTNPPGKDLLIDPGSTGRLGVRAWHR